MTDFVKPLIFVTGISKFFLISFWIYSVESIKGIGTHVLFIDSISGILLACILFYSY